MTKEEKHIEQLIQTSGIVVEKFVDYYSGVSFTPERVETITLGVANKPIKILIILYHELGHFKFLKNKIVRKIVYFIVSHNRYRLGCNYNKEPFLSFLYTFLTCFWELLAWRDAKKELQKTEFWNFEMKKTFFEYRKECLRSYWDNENTNR